MKNRWVRLLLVSVGVEVLYIAFVFLILGSPEAAYSFAGLSGAFLFMMAGGFFVGRKAASRPALWGAAVGIGADIFFILLVVVVIRPPAGEGPQLTPGMGSLLKYLGGAVGGWLGGGWFRRPATEAGIQAD